MKSVDASRTEPSKAKEGDEMGTQPFTYFQSALKAILAEPDTDKLREDYAELLPKSEPRRTFIIDQLTVSRLNFDFTLAKCREAYSNSQGLRNEHHAEWQPDWSVHMKACISYYDFNRGFVELIRLPAAAFLGFAQDLLDASPIRHLDLVESKGKWCQLANFKWLDGIKSISLNNSILVDEDIEYLAQSPYLKQLRWLTLKNNHSITLRGVEALAAQRETNLPNLRYISLEGTSCNPVEEYAADGDVITWQSLPKVGQDLEHKYGRLPWLHIDALRASEIVPGRFQLAQLASVSEELQHR